MTAEPYTPIPNWLIAAMPEMPASVFQVAVVIARQTVGYSDGNGGRKEWDCISLSQFEKVSGLSRRGVMYAIEAGLGKWFQRREKGQYFEYQLVQPVHQCKDCTSATSATSAPELVQPVHQFDEKLVQPVHPQKKERERKKESVSARTRGELADQQAARIVRRDYSGVDARLLTTLTNHVKRISGYGILVENPGADVLEDALRDDAYRLYKLGFNSDEMMCDLEQAWKTYSANFENKMPGKDQLYKVGVMLASGAFRQSSNGANAAAIASGAGGPMKLVPWETTP